MSRSSDATDDAIPIKLIICLDGTSNSEFTDGNPVTNVSRIRRCILPFGYGRTRQIVYYRSGVGTGFQNPLNTLHQATGRGLNQIIIEAYRFLCDNYYYESDEIFLLGFSRGAFAVRCLADLISKHGVLVRPKPEDVHRLYARWSLDDPAGQDVQPENPRPKIKACALWDTVAAVGIPAMGITLWRRLSFIHSEIPHAVENTFQALALHESRYHFFPIVLRCPDLIALDQRLEQCWFAGYHTDAGGGRKSDALAHFALVWMMSKLEPWIRFDMESIRDPLLVPRTTWVIGNPSGPQIRQGSYWLPASDSMTLGFMMGGRKNRIPQTEFWDANGIFSARDRTRENIHMTAGWLTNASLIKPFYCADSTQPNPNERQWTLRAQGPTDGVPEANVIDEDRMDEFQVRALSLWVSGDHRKFDDQPHPAGQPPPNTILVMLQNWLDGLRRMNAIV